MCTRISRAGAVDANTRDHVCLAGAGLWPLQLFVRGLLAAGSHSGGGLLLAGGKVFPFAGFPESVGLGSLPHFFPSFGVSQLTRTIQSSYCCFFRGLTGDCQRC